MAAAKCGESLGGDIVANNGVLKIRPSVDMDCTGNVPGVIEEDVFVRFDDANILVVEVLFEPIPLNQHLRMRVLRSFSIHLSI